MLRDASEVMSGSATLTDHVAPCHGLLSHVFDDLSFRHCCSFRCSPAVIQRKLVTCLSLFLCSAFSAFRYTDVVLTAHFLVVEHCSALIMKFVQFFYCLFQKPSFLPVTDFWSI